MLRNIVDVLKEVFWLKKSAKKTRAARPKHKRPLKPKSKPKLKPKAKTKTVKAAKARKQPKGPVLDPSLTVAGEITHYFDRIKVAVVKVSGSILIGDKLTVFGPKTFFVQKVWSMQIESVDVKVAKKGQDIGLKVDKLVRVGDKVYK